MNIEDEKNNSLEQDVKVLETARKINSVKSKFKKVLLLIIICLICFSLGALFFGRGGGFVGESVETSEDSTVSVNTVKTVLKPASELITGKYYYTNAVSDEDPVSIVGLNLPGTSNKYVFTYDGIISAGYDLQKANIKIDNDSNTILIKMPKLKIISSEVDENSFEIVFKQNSVFNDDDIEQNAKTRAACAKLMKKKAMNDKNFIKLTRENAEVVLKSFLTSSGDTKKYKVEFEYAEED